MAPLGAGLAGVENRQRGEGGGSGRGGGAAENAGEEAGKQQSKLSSGRQLKPWKLSAPKVESANHGAEDVADDATQKAGQEGDETEDTAVMDDERARDPKSMSQHIFNTKAVQHFLASGHIVIEGPELELLKDFDTLDLRTPITQVAGNSVVAKAVQPPVQWMDGRMYQRIYLLIYCSHAAGESGGVANFSGDVYLVASSVQLLQIKSQSATSLRFVTRISFTLVFWRIVLFTADRYFLI